MADYLNLLAASTHSSFLGYASPDLGGAFLLVVFRSSSSWQLSLLGSNEFGVIG